VGGWVWWSGGEWGRWSKDDHGPPAWCGVVCVGGEDDDPPQRTGGVEKHVISGDVVAVRLSVSAVVIEWSGG